jgi:type VI secretion system protein ImpH
MAALLQTPQQFDFFQAVRLLDRWLGTTAHPTPGRGLDKLNFRNSLSTTFAPSAIESLKVHRRTNADEASLARAHEVERIDLTPAFMGLLGVHGALPLFYTEALAQRELYQKDEAGRAFMDLFSHRLVALFYEAWRKHRLAMQFETDRRSRFLPQILSLAGVGQAGLRERLGAGSGAVRDEALAYFAGTLQQRTLSVTQIRQLLQTYLGVPVRIEQFVGRWYALPESARFGLGCQAEGGQGVLGYSAVLGERVWQRDLRLRIELGPLDHARFQRFLPGGAGARALASLLTMLSGVSLEYEVNLRLRKEDVTAACLTSARQTDRGRLGWDTFLQTREAGQDRVDVRYDIASQCETH